MSRPPPTLFATLLGHTAAAFAVFAVAFLGVFAVGYSISRTSWEGAALGKIRAALERTADLADIAGELQGEAVNRALTKIIDPSVFIVVFQTSGRPVFWSWMGRTWYFEDSAAEVAEAAVEGDPTVGLPPDNRVKAVEDGFSRLRDEGLLVPVRRGSAVAGSFYLERQSFEVLAQNSDFMASLVWALAASLIGAAGGTGVFAWRAFRRGVRETALVRAGLAAIAGGRRDVQFPPAGSQELEGIADSALKLQAALAHEQNLRRRWTQDVAHDLKTPLAALRVQLEAVGGGLLSATPERVAVLLEEVGRLETLTANLLVLSHLESPELKLERRRVEAAELLESLENLIAPLAAGAGRELVWNRIEGGFEADAGLLYRALANLLVNALVHAQGPGPVTVAWRLDGDGFHAVIGNPGRLPSGPGSQLFQRLRRGEASRTGRGNGLGLTIAEAVVHLHDGRLTLEAVETGVVEARVDLPL